MQDGFSDGWLENKLQAIDSEKRSVVVFTCNWGGSNLEQALFRSASKEKLKLHFIRTTCSGRIEPSFILNAFEQGAEGVLVVGCPKNGCHYGFGNKHAEEHFGRVQNMLNILGFSSEKFQWVWPETEHINEFLKAVHLFFQGIQKGEYLGSLIE